MADTVLLAQVSFATDTGIPKDAIINTWHFLGDDASRIAATASLTTELATFYATFDEYLSEELSGVATVKWYDINDPQPRAPIAETTFIINVSTGTLSYPQEVALCLSYQAPRVSGTPQSRRRGRVYLGPWTSGAGAGSPNTPVAALRNLIGPAALALSQYVAPVGAYVWCIFSPTIFATGAAFSVAAANVSSGWIDAAWDTQRRRGVESLTRTLW